MPQSSAILHPDSDKAHYLAQGVLCVLAASTVAGVAWAFWHGVGQSAAPGNGAPVATSTGLQTPAGSAAPAPTPLTLPPSTPLPSESTVLAPPVLPTNLSAPSPTVSTFPLEHPPTPTASTLASLPPAPVTNTLPPLTGVPMTPSTMTSLGESAPAPSRLPALPPGKELKNPQARESVAAAREARRLQDMRAALDELRTADLREPNHPEIIGEMALTYEAMGIGTKAQANWKQIAAMGEAEAGGYYLLAMSKLDAAAEAAPAPGAPPSPVRLGNCQVIQDPTVQKGERITVRVPVISNPGATINPGEMAIHVLLFESVNNGERIEQVRAAPPKESWVSEPVNWQDETREELVDVVYDLPPPTAEQIRDLGKRKFHGYIVKLFYQDRLVGEQVQPESLRETARRSTPGGLDNSLFPK
jgi:hypothetical protein